MKQRQRLALLLAACVLFFGREILAEQEVTFEILARFDYPGGSNTFVSGINDRGDVVGSFVNKELNRAEGFVRFADGTFSDPIVNPAGRSTYPSGINNNGTICGSYNLADGATFRGFLLSGSTFTNFDFGAPNTYIRRVNDAGNFCGTTLDQAFVSIDGTLIMFAIGNRTTDAWGINNLNQVVGGSTRLATEYSFRRDADGSIDSPIKAPGFANTDMFDIDDKGRVVGFVVDSDANTQGFLLRPGHRFAFFSYPGASITEFLGINNHGYICGTFGDANGSHGFVVRVRAGG
jgi:uncharacterized membrane protein